MSRYLKYLFNGVVLSCLFSCTAPLIPQDGRTPVDFVNPLVGTASSFELSTGNTYPAIARPWGMNFWTPQTGRNCDGWTYTYSATKIRGLKQTHQPSPWINDYGQFSLMPVTLEDEELLVVAQHEGVLDGS